MKSIFYFLGIVFVLGSSCTQDRIIEEEKVIIIDPASELLYYWNFNLELQDVTEVIPTYSLITASNAKITYPGTGVGKMDIAIDGYITNARDNDPAENLLKVRNPSNTRSLVLDLPTIGYKKIVLQFATGRSNNGAITQNYSYTTDGINYVNSGLEKISHNPNVDPTPPLPDVDLITLDFSNIPAIDSNPNFKIKIDFVGDAAANPTGNNRFDNVTLEGVPLQ